MRSLKIGNHKVKNSKSVVLSTRLEAPSLRCQCRSHLWAQLSCISIARFDCWSQIGSALKLLMCCRFYVVLEDLYWPSVLLASLLVRASFSPSYGSTIGCDEHKHSWRTKDAQGNLRKIPRPYRIRLRCHDGQNRLWGYCTFLIADPVTWLHRLPM